MPFFAPGDPGSGPQTADGRTARLALVWLIPAVVDKTEKTMRITADIPEMSIEITIGGLPL